MTLSFRLEWPKDHYFPPCALTFRDGWEPPSLTTSQEPSQLTESLVGVQRREEPTARQPEVSGSGSGPMFSPAHRNISTSDSSNKHLQVLEQDAVDQDPER